MTLRGAFKDGAIELPGLSGAIVLQSTDGGEIIDVNGGHEPTATAQPGHVGGRLQETAELARASAIVGATVEGLDHTGTVQQSSIATAGDGDPNIREVGGIARDAVDVPRGVEIADVDMAEEIFHGLNRVVSPFRQPGGFVWRELRGAADRRPIRRTGGIRRSITIGGIGEGSGQDFQFRRGGRGV